jgi:hypothetical protein
MRFLATLVIVAAAALPADSALAASNGTAAYRMAASMSATIGRCWFGKGEKAFAGYVHASETNAIAGPPRVLIVKKSAPHARPELVIEFRTESDGVRVNVYGPLIETERGTRIAADINRWADGSGACN